MENKQMKRNDLIELVKSILTSPGTESEVDALVAIFLNNVPDPGAIDYLYAKKYEGLTPEQIVDKALSYKPFYL